MKSSSVRILTTHVGSLPRSKVVTDGVFAKENERPYNEQELASTIASAVNDVVAKQVAVGVDVVSDGEMSKISYATYIKDRITGFEGDSERNPPSDLEEFPGFLNRQSSSGGTPSYRRPCCVAEIKVKDMQPLQEDLENLSAAVNQHQPLEGFMNAASPGVIALFQIKYASTFAGVTMKDRITMMRQWISFCLLLCVLTHRHCYLNPLIRVMPMSGKCLRRRIFQKIKF